MKENRTERNKLEQMVEARRKTRGPRLVVGIGTPIEFKKALIEGGRGKVETGIQIRLERKRRDAFNELASQAELPVAELVRLLIGASLKVGLSGVRRFVSDASEEAGDLPKKFRKAKGKKRRGVLDAGPEREANGEDDELHYEDDGEPEEDDEEDDEDELEADPTGEPTPQLKRKKKAQRTGAPRPEKSPKIPKDGRPGSLS